MAATCSRCNISDDGLCIHEKTLLLSIGLVSMISIISYLVW
ncbi:MAG: hypothetical protein ABEJ93_03430 [Candidatus Nanohalobium sp.]